MVFMVFMVPSQHIGHLGFGFVGIYGTLTAFVHPAFKPLGLPRVKLLQAKSPQIMVFMVFMVPSQHFWHLGFGFFGFYGTLMVFRSLR